MRVRPSTIVGTLVRRHPEAEEILGWYGISLNKGELRITLAQICQAYRLDLEDVLIDIQAVVEDEYEEEDEEEDGQDYVESWVRESGEDDDDERWTN